MDWTGTYSVANLQVGTLLEAWQWHPILAGGSEGKAEVLWMVPNWQLYFRPDVLWRGKTSQQILLQAVLPVFSTCLSELFEWDLGCLFKFSREERETKKNIGTDCQKNPCLLLLQLLCRAKEFITLIFLFYSIQIIMFLSSRTCWFCN